MSKCRRIRSSLVAISIILAGSEGVLANGSPGEVWGDLQTLDTAEMRSLLHNVSLRPVYEPDIQVSHREVERYYENGEYVRLGGRVTHTGTFDIENGRVCVRLREVSGPECFRISRDSEGHIWKIGEAGDSRTRVEVLSTTTSLLLVGPGGVLASRPPGEVAEALETMGTVELRALLRNVSLRRVADPNIQSSDPGVETFYQGGEYVRWGDRAHRFGTFVIEDGRVCIRLGGIRVPECFGIYRDSEGHIWKIGEPGGTRTRVDLFSME